MQKEENMLHSASWKHRGTEAQVLHTPLIKESMSAQ